MYGYVEGILRATGGGGKLNFADETVQIRIDSSRISHSAMLVLEVVTTTSVTPREPASLA